MGDSKDMLLWSSKKVGNDDGLIEYAAFRLFEYQRHGFVSNQ